ncbi:glycoside hydrolase family 3 N-terminal domain-containing protein [uncultured Porphyromonas sp.]|uniref:glycoside hydrolase family 3 protein n=1 Tax=uncultured Porphyromonas sp. TaxID=159274 RepID=UPI00261DF0A3|nr:glycoside hydrolase family 3 N-terminal domain-containing protein [uncultured Porphyromonas sp.]
MKYTKQLVRWCVSLGKQVQGGAFMRHLAVVSMTLGILVSCAGGSTTAQQLPMHLVPMSERASDSLVRVASDWLSTLTIEEQIGQLIIPIWEPRYDSASRERYLRLIDQIHPGGILFRKGEPYDQYRLTHLLQERSRIPLLITADAEWGLAMRLQGTIRYPRMKLLADHCTPEEMYTLGQHMAQQCRVMGIHVSFAPVLDVNNNPKNPVIGTRSLGATPDIVISHGLALARGLEDGGVLSVAKHFPGHGNTDKDSHKTLPTVSGSLEELERVELAPFRAYIEAGLGGIMVAHLSVPALEPDVTCPSSLSHAVVTGLLREQLGFKGLIFTDGLEMRGVQRAEGLPISVAAILAGNDLLLGPLDPLASYQELLSAYRAGTLSAETIQDRCLRVLCYKLLLHAGETSERTLYNNKEELYEALHTPEIVTFAEYLQNKVSKK